MNRKFGRNDIIFLGILVVFCIAACVAVYTGGGGMGNSVTVTVDGEVYGTYSLFTEQTIRIEENHHVNEITIKDGKAYMSSASCPDGLCKNQNAISFDKQSIVCLPNKVVVTVTSDEKSDVDLIIK